MALKSKELSFLIKFFQLEKIKNTLSEETLIERYKLDEYMVERKQLCKIFGAHLVYSSKVSNAELVELAILGGYKLG